MINSPITKTGGTSFYTSILPASLSVEASVIFPIYILFFAFVLSIFSVLKVELQVEGAMSETVRTMCLNAYLTENLSEKLSDAEWLAQATDLVEFGEANLLLRKNIREKDVYSYILGGVAGLICDADTEGDEVTLTVSYVEKLPIGFFGKKTIPRSQTITGHKWNGYTFTEESGEEKVYITPDGEVYHRNKYCKYVRNNGTGIDEVSLISARSLDRNIYYPCEYCDAETKGLGQYYVTSYGTRYHTTLSCQCLKRTVCRVGRNEVGGRRLCSECWGIDLE